MGAKSFCLALIFNLWAFPPNGLRLSGSAEGAVRSKRRLGGTWAYDSHQALPPHSNDDTPWRQILHDPRSCLLLMGCFSLSSQRLPKPKRCHRAPMKPGIPHLGRKPPVAHSLYVLAMCEEVLHLQHAIIVRCDLVMQWPAAIHLGRRSRNSPAPHAHQAFVPPVRFVPVHLLLDAVGYRCSRFLPTTIYPGRRPHRMR